MTFAAKEASGPLAGFRVLDLTGVLMGPFATTILGDLGADVVKVEAPEGDTTRWIGPARNPGMSASFLQLNRSKRSVVLDLKKEAGREALLRLAARSDVFIFNLRPQTMARLRLSYADIAAVNSRIVYCGLYGFGERGRYAGKPAYDDLIQGAVGLPSLGASLDGEPRYLPITICDRNTGLTAVYTVLAALLYRERTGRGQAIEVPMFETMAQYVLSDHLYGRTFEPPLAPPGYVRLLTPERRPYKTKDGYICALIYNDKHWHAFATLIGRPELMQDERFCSLGARTRHIGEVYSLVAETFAHETTSFWLEKLEAVDIPALPMATLDTLLEDPHLADVGFFQMVDHPSEGRLRSMANPTNWSETAPVPARPAPRLGEHTRAVLAEIGYSEEDVDALIASGAAGRSSGTTGEAR